MALDIREVLTIQALVQHCDYIYEALDENNIFFSMYLDFQKAFDSVDHSVLLGKLHFYGVRGSTYLWFSSYLSGRK